MIKVFRANETNYTTNGEVILKPIEAIIFKNLEEEYLEVICPLKYADFLLQDNIIMVDSLTGRKGYKIHNPIKSNTITVKAWLCYEERRVPSADRGATIQHGKNLEHCKVIETWDNVVTKLIPIGYNEITLPEGYLSIPTPYQKVYERTIEFELSEELEEQVEQLEQDIKDNSNLVTGLTSGIEALTTKITTYTQSITLLQNEKIALQRRLTELGTSEAELKEKAIIEAQLPLIDSEIQNLNSEKTNTQSVLSQSRLDLVNAETTLEQKQTAYNNLLITDLRQQATDYLERYKYPQINYDLEAHLNGVIELGDIIKVNHPRMRVNLLTNVTAFQFDLLMMQFKQIEFGTIKPTLKSKFNEIDKKIDKVKNDGDKTAERVTKYSEEFKRDNKEMYSKYMSEIYGYNKGIYGLLQKNTSMLRQTASLISGTVERVNANLSKDIALLEVRADSIVASVTNVNTDLNEKIAQLRITADEIRASVSSNYTTLDGKIANNTSLISQTATQIRSEVTQTLRSYSTTTQMNSAISQSAESITSTVTTQINGVRTEISQVEQTANKINWLVKSGSSSSNFTLTDRAIALVAQTIDLSGLVTISNLQTSGRTIINGDNITTGAIDASRVSVKNLSASSIITGTLNANLVTISNLSANSITTGAMSANRLSGGTIDASLITVKNLSADSITSGALSLNYIKVNGYLVMNQGSYSNSINIGGTNYQYVQTVQIGATTFEVKSTYSRLCSGSAFLGFFGASGSRKTSIYTVSSSATLSTLITEHNKLVTALNSYGLV